ncbi:hypothetical protein V8F33_001443 [Rhypophila sp. PSN 637]
METQRAALKAATGSDINISKARIIYAIKPRRQLSQADRDTVAHQTPRPGVRPFGGGSSRVSTVTVIFSILLLQSGILTLNRLDSFKEIMTTQILYLNDAKRSFVISDGYCSAFGTMVCAIILNQVRFILLPWLGVDIWQNPIEQLRLARSNPDVFLDEYHAYSWKWFLFSAMQREVCSRLAALAAVKCMTTEQSLNSDSNPSCCGMLEWVCKVGYLVWIFATVEFLFSRSVSFCAVITAVWKLASGQSSHGRAALEIVTGLYWHKMFVTGVQVVRFGRFTVYPLFAEAASCLLDGRLGFPFFIGFLMTLVWAIIVHRSFFFIALQMSGMFIAFGWLMVGLWVLLGTCFADEPDGVKLSDSLACSQDMNASEVRLLQKEGTFAGIVKFCAWEHGKL